MWIFKIEKIIVIKFLVIKIKLFWLYIKKIILWMIKKKKLMKIIFRMLCVIVVWNWIFVLFVESLFLVYCYIDNMRLKYVIFIIILLNIGGIVRFLFNFEVNIFVVLSVKFGRVFLRVLFNVVIIFVGRFWVLFVCFMLFKIMLIMLIILNRLMVIWKDSLNIKFLCFWDWFRLFVLCSNSNNRGGVRYRIFFKRFKFGNFLVLSLFLINLKMILIFIIKVVM